MIIFLDIDGVLNRESDWKHKFSVRQECILALSKIYSELQCSGIALSSTWRVCESENQSDYYKDFKDMLKTHNMYIIGTTPLSKKSREEEILYYAKRHDITHYLTLDDDPSLFLHKDIPLYLTDYKTGLQDGDVKKIVKFVKKYWKGR